MFQLSAKIYKSQSHERLVQLMKHQLMEVYDNWGERNLFKYGANHLGKAESFLDVHNIENLVANLNDARYKKSIHIMILGSSGTQASPFEGFPSEEISPDSEMIKTLWPLITTVEGLA